ncbi:MAG: glycosyltransferase family 4 protein [Candidatus Thorarchaeota archaeon]
MQLRICMIQPPSNQSIPLRTQLAEVYGEHLTKKGHHVVVILQGRRYNKYDWNGITVYEIPSIQIWKQVPVIRRIIFNEKCNLLQIRNSHLDGLVALFLRRILGIPLVYQYTLPSLEYARSLQYSPSISFFIKKFRYLFNDTLQYRCMHGSDLVLAMSEEMGKYLISRKIPERKIYTFPSGASTDRYDIDSSKKSNKDGKSPLVTYVGTMSKMRKLEFLIESINVVLDENPNVRFQIVGDGNDRKHLENLSRKLGIGKSIDFTGKVPYSEIPEILTKSDIGVSPIPPISPYFLSSPLKLYEYLAAGLPVVANKGIPDQEKTIKESGGGILTSYDPEDFGKGILKLADNLENADRMGMKGRAWIQSERSYFRSALEIEEALLKTVRNNSL